jgi:uncharacterized protein
MTQSRQAVTEFLAQRTLALAGASREGKKFGSAVLTSLRAKGYRVLLVHPNAAALEGIPCVKSLRDLPEPVGGLVIVVHPEETLKLVREAAEAGITRIWMQTGAESAEAIALCKEHNISVVYGECILMFAEPAEFFHRAHRFVRRVQGKLPR